MSSKPTLLLVHGSWHGPWCWEKLTPVLERLGYPWASVALPSVGATPATMGTMEDDARAIEAAAAEIAGDVVVVAHSYSGVPATEATFGPNVRRIVYLAAFMPDVGGSLASFLPPGPLPAFVVAHEDGSTSVHPELGIAALYADVDAPIAAWAMSRLRLHHARVITAPVSHTSWREVPTSYILMTEDFACPTIVQRSVCHQADEVRELKGSHSPFLAQPETLAAVLDDIVEGHAGNGLRRVG
jgi:pimeloyl-ACP methyl ester carboxylesterase